MDFMNYLEPDMSVQILMCLQDPADLVRISAVSRSWRHFVIANGLCKNLCLRMFPQLSRMEYVSELDSVNEEQSDFGSSSSIEWKTIQTEHKGYAFLARAVTTFPVKDCISEACAASSTDNFPVESIDNTLESKDRVGGLPSYWSSKGQSDPAVPETLLYKLDGDLCVVTEINVQPFQAYFQRGLPIYSARAVRFRMGHCQSFSDGSSSESADVSPEDRIVWTYTSQEFPMAQENRLQKFKFPEPVLCIGGYLLIELLGRIQRQETDGLFYICICHVQAIGRSLSGAFGVEILGSSDKFVLKVLSYKYPTIVEDPDREDLRRRMRNLQSLVAMLRRRPLDMFEYVWGIPNGEDEASDEDGP